MRQLPAKPSHAWSDLWRVVWTTPLFAAPFAAFFLLIGGGGLEDWWQYGIISVCFAFGARLPIWAFEWFGVPRIRFLHEHPRGTLFIGIAYGLIGMLGAVMVAVILSSTMLPGFMGSPRAVLYVLVFSMLFASLFVGFGLAFTYHRRAVDRAGAERELTLARRIQESFLLSEFPCRPKLEVHAVDLSSRQVSGDFHDVVPLGEDGALLAVADVSGKGVPAALLSPMLQAAHRTHATTDRSLSEVMTGINSLVCQRAITGQFATFFLAAIHERDLVFRSVNAGHNPPVLIRADGEMFGDERLAALLSGIPARLSAREQVEQVLTGLRSFLAGIEPQDDVTVMVLRITEPSTI